MTTVASPVLPQGYRRAARPGDGGRLKPIDGTGPALAGGQLMAAMDRPVLRP